jgi:hypothetical protein
MTIVVPEKGDEIEQIGGIKGPVFKLEQFPGIGLLMLQDKLIRRLIHELHQLLGFPDNGRAVAPRKNGREKTGDLDVLLPGIPMGYAYRVVDNKGWPVILRDFFVQKCL